MSRNLIIVFTRNPELGKVKTRLAKTVGDKSALEIYKHLLSHTESVLHNIDADKAVYYSVKIRKNDIWDDNIYQKHKQLGKDLGIRMEFAFEQAFKSNYNKVLIVGSDLYDLKESHIKEAFKQLNSNDVVIGPAEDGGYYLLGMKRLYSQVFHNKNWGTETVFKNTVCNLKNEKIHHLEILNDIDVFDDMKHIEALQKFIPTND